MKTASIFVDVQNIYYTTKQSYGQNFDYNKFWALVTREREVVTAIAYATFRGDKKQTEFQNILRGIGFKVKLKPFIKRGDGSTKGDWDVGIAIDVMKYAQNSDVVILASGDGDFDLLLKEIKTSYNTQSEVFGVPGLTANSLINAATTFIPIEKSLLLK
ncbi:MAG: nuclease [Rhodospirillaceae bacterium]|nr:nuclease [Rhodospirillaceae bacterium]|tara:strand:+ start:4053 stop:4529 length:477 start_codon:yes stop_codon:yes gene_type:complete